jgi:hypothetical protein
MDYELGVWVLCQQKERARRALNPPNPDAPDILDDILDDTPDDAPDVPAGTFDVPAETSGASLADELELEDPNPYNADG